MNGDKTKGLVIVHTGDGKGKTTAALGMMLRAFGNGMSVLVLQFIKGGQKYGEFSAIEKLAAAGGKIAIKQYGLGFTQRNDSREAEHKKAAENALRLAHDEIVGGKWDMVILDEINYAVKFGLIDEADVLSLIDARDEKTHLVLTGRDAGEKIVEKADLVTEMKLIKHPFASGVKAQRGIEF